MAGGDGSTWWRRRTVWLGVAAVLLLVAAAAATPGGIPMLGARQPRTVVMPSPPALFHWLLLAMAVIAVGVFIALKKSVAGNTVENRRRSAWAAVIALALFLALWATSPDLREWLQERFGDPPVEAGEEPRETEPGAGLERVTSRTYGYLLTVVVALVLAAVATGAVLLFYRDKTESTVELEESALLAGIDASLVDIETLSDPRAAVIACYAHMQDASARAGIRRRESDTPYELLARVLARRGVDTDAARRLTELFERAKFSRDPIGEDDRRQAVAALETIRGSLGVNV